MMAILSTVKTLCFSVSSLLPVDKRLKRKLTRKINRYTGLEKSRSERIGCDIYIYESLPLHLT